MHVGITCSIWYIFSRVAHPLRIEFLSPGITRHGSVYTSLLAGLKGRPTWGNEELLGGKLQLLPSVDRTPYMACVERRTGYRGQVAPGEGGASKGRWLRLEVKAITSLYGET